MIAYQKVAKLEQTIEKEIGFLSTEDYKKVLNETIEICRAKLAMLQAYPADPQRNWIDMYKFQYENLPEWI